MHSSFKLESLLETHELPFIVVSSDLQVVAVNQAWEQAFDQDRFGYVGRNCCLDSHSCRHQQLFKTLEPYAGVYPLEMLGGEPKLASVRGMPLLDDDGRLYLAESLSLLSRHCPNAGQGMVGESAVFLALKSRLQQASQLLAPVLLTGETGTGKELAAEFIHQNSVRANQELVIADCTVFSEELFESELFGHEKGAFTGATSSKKGLFELADNSTLFLDEIGELPLAQQAKLLRALEKGQFRRVGGTATLKADVRVVCATHRNLAEMVEKGQFREDLFYRLSVFPIQIPSLRERTNDIKLLSEHFLAEMSEKQRLSYALEPSALQKLLQHDWPGNIRELKNCLQLACGLCQSATIRTADIQFMRPISRAKSLTDAVSAANAYSNPIEQYEATFIRDLMTKYQGNRRLIAAEMNISERTLYRKLNRLNLS